MGTNSPNQSPGAYGAFSGPQAAGIRSLANAAVTPTQGTSPAAGAASQLATALMAAQRMRQWKNKYGIPTYGNPAVQPGQVTAPAALPGTAAPDFNPNAGGGSYA